MTRMNGVEFGLLIKVKLIHVLPFSYSFSVFLCPREPRVISNDSDLSYDSMFIGFAICDVILLDRPICRSACFSNDLEQNSLTLVYQNLKN